jgi:hypothetical protein
MKFILKHSITLLIVLLFYSCTTHSDPKKGLFKVSFEGEAQYVCVNFLYQQDTIIYCGFKESLYATLQPNLEEYDFYQRCSNTDISPIPIDSTQFELLKGNIIVINDSIRAKLNGAFPPIEELKQHICDYLNSNKFEPLSDDMLLSIYQCWLHNTVIYTGDEVYYWCSHSY